MRWSNLTLEAEAEHRLPGYADPAVVRRFDAPEALDMRFYEIRARSILNRVPKASQMPFRWTVNPYRGCSHACVYCLDGETPILMADGSTRPLAELGRGDRIYGTERRGTHRRFAETDVLDHWSTVKPAFRVTLADGTELVASGDHRFLTTRGWKQVTGTQQGPARRPHLTIGTELLGTGALSGRAGKTSARLEVVDIERLAGARRLYDITTGTGDFIANGVISHNCFARPTHTYLDFDAGRDFEREIVVKVNAPECLRADLARPSWRREHVALGTNTDPYQWVESRYRLLPGIWEALLEAGTPCSVLTKSPLLLRDLAHFQKLVAGPGFVASLSVPTIDERAWRASEPHTPSPRARLDAVGALNRAGVPTGVLVAPLMPGINDDPRQVERILERAADAGATSIGGIALHLRGEVRGVFMDWLRSYRPELVPRYERLYARGAYAPRAERARLSALTRGDTGPWRETLRRRGTPPAGALPGPRGDAAAPDPEEVMPPAAQTRLFDSV